MPPSKGWQMAKKSFSPLMIDALTKGSIAVPDCAGLTIEVGATGKKVWKYKRRVAGGGAIVKMTLGQFPAHTIPDAREWANDLNLQIERGENPKAKLEAIAKIEAMTVDKAQELYIASCYRPDRKRPICEASINAKRELYRIAKPVIGLMPINDVTDDILWEIVEDKAQLHAARANRLASEMKTFFKWCAGRAGKLAGVGLVIDPATSLDASAYREGKRKRFLSDAELRLFLVTLSESRSLVEFYPETGRERVEERCRVYRRAILLMLLTGCRKREVLEAKASEYRNGIWTLPGPRVKNREEHAIPLAPWGRALMATKGDWIIPSWKIEGAMSSGWYKVLNRIIERMGELNGAEVPRFTFHDLRRTLRSNAENLDISDAHAEAMINHKLTGLMAIYKIGDMLPQKAIGFAKWENKIAGIARDAGVADALYLPEPSPQGA
jgi:integrase